MTRAGLVAAAAAIDVLAGDPHAIPHPVTAIGRWVRMLEPRARRCGDLAGGALLACCTIAAAAATGARLDRAPAPVRAIAAASTLAGGSLLDHAARVRDALERHDLPAARAAVAQMVGRDTATLDESGVARAAIESLAESLCDGVIAPVLALALFSLRGAFAYKAINTLDSLIGHIEPPYTYFGRTAARIDDAANLVPARLGALCIAAAAAICGKPARRSLRVALRDGRKHRSPNAGFGEAAMAGALGVRLGGASAYDGVAHEAPAIGAEFRVPQHGDVRDAMRIVFIASLIAYAGATLLALRR